MAVLFGNHVRKHSRWFAPLFYNNSPAQTTLLYRFTLTPKGQALCGENPYATLERLVTNYTPVRLRPLPDL